VNGQHPRPNHAIFGLGNHGHGLLAFSTPGEAVSEIAAVEADYSANQNAARELACTHFDAHQVLTEMLNRIGLGQRYGP
jgi:hypothetical protein